MDRGCRCQRPIHRVPAEEGPCYSVLEPLIDVVLETLIYVFSRQLTPPLSGAA
jgi:hypothetical protein